MTVASSDMATELKPCVPGVIPVMVVQVAPLSLLKRTAPEAPSVAARMTGPFISALENPVPAVLNPETGDQVFPKSPLIHAAVDEPLLPIKISFPSTDTAHAPGPFVMAGVVAPDQLVAIPNAGAPCLLDDKVFAPR